MKHLKIFLVIQLLIQTMNSISMMTFKVEDLPKDYFGRIILDKYEFFNNSNKYKEIIDYLLVNKPVLSIPIRLQEIYNIGAMLIFLTDVFSTDQKIEFIKAMQETWQKYGMEHAKIKAEKLKKRKQNIKVEDIFEGFASQLSFIEKLLGIAKKNNILKFTINSAIADHDTFLDIAEQEGRQYIVTLLQNLGATKKRKIKESSGMASEMKKTKNQ